MDASNPAATTAAGYLGGTASWRTDLYTGRGTLMTLTESIQLNENNGVKHTPELKEGKAIRKDSDMYKALDVLARQVGIIGIFSDWPATVTYYANCMGLK
jgi:hypothetical protein